MPESSADWMVDTALVVSAATPPAPVYALAGSALSTSVPASVMLLLADSEEMGDTDALVGAGAAAVAVAVLIGATVTADPDAFEVDGAPATPTTIPMAAAAITVPMIAAIA